MMTSRTATALASRARSASSPRPPLTRAALALSTALTPVWAAADTLPTGGTVVHGRAAIGAPAAGAMTIDQSSGSAVVNWDSFSIGTGNRVTINQPSADAAILNRVTGDATSQIHGQLNANGRVFVINPNGIFIGPTGRVNAGSFVASTLNVRTEDFVLGNMVFEGDGASASVVNQGQVEVVSGGYAALIGGQVSNAGTIRAPMGFVGLGSGERITLDLGGDGFLQVAVPTDSDDPALQALIENSGTIEANGGTVQMSAASARQAARHAINMSGVVEARSVSGRNGRITLGGGGGKVSVSGRVRATAARPVVEVTQSARPTARPARGGEITVTGGEITLAGAEIDASGPDGGGDIRIGGNLRGGPGLPQADRLSVDSASTVRADAWGTGDGGRVILWSELNTDFEGTISVRGGDLGGDGGFAEVSGKQVLRYAGFTDARAPEGDRGTLLLDPSDVEIVGSAPGTNQILNTTIQTALASADVEVATNDNAGDFPFPDSSEAGNLQVLAPITWTSGSTLTLNAEGTIDINAPITGTNGRLFLRAANDSGSNLIRTSAAGTVDVGVFRITEGFWEQVNATLPSFNATNFVLEETPDVSFLRALGGDGSSTPYQITDVYGLQGAPTVNSGLDSFELANDISMVPTFTWFSLLSDGNGNRSQGLVPLDFEGSFDGAGFTISDLFIQRVGTVNSDTTAGLFRNLGSAAFVENLTLLRPLLDGSDVGALAAANEGRIDAVTVEGGSIGSFQQVAGGLVGVNASSGIISGVRVNTIVGVGTDPSDGSSATIPQKFYGGIAGINDGGIEESKTAGDINMRFVTTGFLGGIAGDNPGTVFDSYSEMNLDANVTDAVTTSIAIGGIAGRNTGEIEATLVTGPVTLTGTNQGALGGEGAIVGNDDPGIDTVLDSYYDLNTTTQPTSGAVGEPLAENPGLNTADLQDVDLITSAIEAAGWDTQVIWSLPQDGIDYPRLYRVDPVISADDTTSGLTFTYNGTTTFAAQNSQYFGGPSVFEFGPVGDSGDLTTLDPNLTASDPNVGAITVRFPTSFTSNLGQDYDVRSRNIAATIDPAPLVVTIDPTTKVFGTVLTFGDVNFSAATLFGTDQITGGTVVSAGAPANAPTSGNPYTLDLSGLTGPGITNYTVSTVPGTLTITEAGLTININNLNKVYGDTLTFSGTEFSTVGLLDGDSVTSLTLSSPGASAGATVAGGPYTISGSNPIGDGLDGYTITIVPGTLTVTRRPATINVPNIAKTYGNAISLGSSNFTVSGLVGSDSITGLSLSSAGTAATAPVSGSPYPITASNPVGTGADNYTLTVTAGTVTVNPAPLTITADDQQKGFGESFTFTGTEFTVSGLLNTDSVSSATLTSAATDATAPLTGQTGEAIFISDAEGTGLDNYAITFVDGVFVVAPGDLIITPTDLNKTYGDELIFAGTEFTVEGLAPGDSVDSVTLTSAGSDPSAQVTGSPYAINAAMAVGSGLEKYDLVFADGSLTVVAAPLTVTALDQTKQQGQAFTFAGTEFTTVGLRNGDSVDSVVLSSPGAAAEAQADDGPFAITVGEASGSGLNNYTITPEPGTFTVQNIPPEQPVNPEPPATTGNGTLINPTDTITIGFTSEQVPLTGPNASIGIGTTTAEQEASTTAAVQVGRSTQTLEQAEENAALVEALSTEVELAVQSCGTSDQDFSSYMACLAESLDTYANALDDIVNDLPPEFEQVSAVIRQARDGVSAAGARAEARLATATTEAQRIAIRRDAINEARGAIANAQNEIRKAINLIRADDPELAAVQRQTGARIVQAFDTIDTELVRAVEL